MMKAPTFQNLRLAGPAIYKRIATQVGVFPGSNIADFDTLVRTGNGVEVTAPGYYKLKSGLWRVSAQVMLQMAATAERPRVSLFSDADGGSFPFFQEILGLDTTAGGVAAFSVYALVPVKATTLLNLIWETDTAGSDLYVPGGLGCTLQLERLP